MKALKPFYKALYYLVFAFAQVVVRIVYPIRTIGRKNLPKEEGYVVAPNHLFAIDPMYILLARGFRKKMMIMGKEELFKISPIVNFFWYVFGAFPVDRGTGDMNLLEHCVQEVKTGRSLFIFPEGTRSKTGNLGRLKSGAFVVAMRAGASMVPCHIWYKAGSPKPFRRITVMFGKPVTMEEMGLTGEYSAAKLREAKKVFAARIEELHEANPSRKPNG